MVTGCSRGLSTKEAGRELAEHGAKQLPEPPRQGPRLRFPHFHNGLICVRPATTAVTYVMQDRREQR